MKDLRGNMFIWCKITQRESVPFTECSMILQMPRRDKTNSSLGRAFGIWGNFGSPDSLERGYEQRDI